MAAALSRARVWKGRARSARCAARWRDGRRDQLRRRSRRRSTASKPPMCGSRSRSARARIARCATCCVTSGCMWRGSFVCRSDRFSWRHRRGRIDEVPTRVLRDQLGEKLATTAGADFSAPIVQRKQEPAAEARHSEARGGKPAEPRRAGASSPLPSRAKRDGGEAGSPSRQRDGGPRSGVGGKTKREKRPASKFARPRRGENARPSFDERDEPRRGRPPRRRPR